MAYYELIHYFAFSLNQNQCDSRYLLGDFIKNNSLFENLIFYMTEKKSKILAFLSMCIDEKVGLLIDFSCLWLFLHCTFFFFFFLVQVFVNIYGQNPIHLHCRLFHSTYFCWNRSASNQIKSDS